MAARKKNATRLGAHLGFADESGFMMIPPVRRTWAPVGQTPIVRHYYFHFVTLKGMWFNDLRYVPRLAASISTCRCWCRMRICLITSSWLRRRSGNVVASKIWMS